MGYCKTFPKDGEEAHSFSVLLPSCLPAPWPKVKTHLANKALPSEPRRACSLTQPLAQLWIWDRIPAALLHPAQAQQYMQHNVGSSQSLLPARSSLAKQGARPSHRHA